MSDAAIRELERRIAEGDAAAWPELDAMLSRRGLPPRRFWQVRSTRGEYSDREDLDFVPIFDVKADALSFMHRLVKDLGREDWRLSENNEEYSEPRAREGRMWVGPVEAVPAWGKSLTPCPWRHHAGSQEQCALTDGHA